MIVMPAALRPLLREPRLRNAILLEDDDRHLLAGPGRRCCNLRRRAFFERHEIRERLQLRGRRPRRPPVPGRMPTSGTTTPPLPGQP